MKNLHNPKICLTFADAKQMVPWPSGEAPVCKTVYSSSILLGTSKALILPDQRFFFGVMGMSYICGESLHGA